MNRPFLCLMVLLLGIFARAETPLKLKPEPVRFRSGDSTLNGCVYRPSGKGPFPAIIFNQAATRPSYEKIDWPPFSSLAQFFTSQGYVFFLPGRYNHETAQIKTADPKPPGWQAESDARNADVLASITWLKSQSYVDEDRVILAGHSAGAIQALLVAEKKPEIRGTIAFSVGAISWKGSTVLQEVLQKAVKNIDTPMFILQPQNDFSIEPSRVLGEILRDKNSRHIVKVYPPFGKTPSEANLFGLNGSSVWGDDVMKFIREATKPR